MTASHLHPSLLFQPKVAWTQRPLSTANAMARKASARVQRGIEAVDFGEQRSPFQLNVIARAQAVAQGAI
jgi:hypothetical protein